MINRKGILGGLNHVFFNHALGSTVDVRDSTFMSMAITSGASQLILSEQVVTCLAHSKE